MDHWAAVGIGLDSDTMRLTRTTEEWLIAGDELRDQLAALFGHSSPIEQIGSAAVLGLLAKPVVDLALGLTTAIQLAGVTATLETAGWIYRGDAGESGGHVFVLETRPGHRIAHLHVVELGGAQWMNYLQFRDLLRSSTEARLIYELEKVRLSDRHGNDRAAYTEGKTAVVTSLLASAMQQAQVQAQAYHPATMTAEAPPSVLEPIAGVDLAMFARISAGLAQYGYDQTQAVGLAAAQGIDSTSWQTALDGWNQRIAAHPVVAQRFTAFYPGRG
ncbi:MAG: GrpB family protein [Ilumatobacteraceae bacterium]